MRKSFRVTIKAWVIHPGGRRSTAPCGYPSRPLLGESPAARNRRPRGFARDTPPGVSTMRAMAEARIEHVFNCSEETFWTKLFFDQEYNRRLFTEELAFPVWKEVSKED